MLHIVTVSIWRERESYRAWELCIFCSYSNVIPSIPEMVSANMVLAEITAALIPEKRFARSAVLAHADSPTAGQLFSQTLHISFLGRPNGYQFAARSEIDQGPLQGSGSFYRWDGGMAREIMSLSPRERLKSEGHKTSHNVPLTVTWLAVKPVSY